MNADLVLFAVFVAVVAALLYYDRKNVSRQGIILMRRTQRGRRIIDSIAQRAPRLWNALALLGIVFGIAAMVYMPLLLAQTSLQILDGKKAGGLSVVLPAPIQEAQLQPGLLLLPWWVWIIGILAVVVPHELFHGIMCRVDRIRVKSVGWALLAIIPGAFVEPDEKQLKKARRTIKLKVYAAGSLANMIVALLILPLLVLAFGAFTPTGVDFIANETSVFGKNISGFITGIDSAPITGIAALHTVTANYKPGDAVTVSIVDKGRNMPKFSARTLFEPVAAIDSKDAQQHRVTLRAGPAGEPYFGVVSNAFVAVQYSEPAFSLYMLVFWIFILSFGIGLVNMLPIKPLDGGLFFEELLGRFTAKSGFVTKYVSLLVLALLLFNLIGPWVF